MNTLEFDLHTLFSLQAEAMEVPPVGTPEASVGHIHPVSTVPGRRWMLAAAAVVLVVGGGLAFAQRQPVEPPMADTIDDRAMTATVSDGVSTGEQVDSTSAGRDGSTGTKGDPVTSGGSSADGTVGWPVVVGPAPTGGSPAPKGGAPETNPGGDDERPDKGSPDGALPPACGEDDTAVHVGGGTDILVTTVGKMPTLDFFVYSCAPIDPGTYHFEASVGDPSIVEIVETWNGTVTLRLLAEGITSVKVHVTDDTGNPVGSVIVPIQVQAHDGDSPSDPTDTDPGASDPGVPTDPDVSDPDDGWTLPLTLDDLSAIIVGLTEAEAAVAVDALGIELRVALLDGVTQPGGKDYRYGRYDVAVVEGVITAVLAHG